MGTVADHDYFNFFGTKLPLPRIIYWADANGDKQLSFFSGTESAIHSGQFQEVDHALVPTNGSIVIDLSILRI